MAKEKKVKKERNEAEASNHVSLLSSIGAKIIFAVAIAVILAVILLVRIIVPDVKTEIGGIMKNYLLDLAGSSGQHIELTAAELGEEELLGNYDILNSMLADVKLAGIDSSYAYLVDNQGTMLYHPTADKVGNPVENSVVKGLVADLQAGKNPGTDVVEYEFKGAMKYASYYVGKSGAYILVITADEDDIMAPVDEVTRRGMIGGAVAILIGLLFAWGVGRLITKPIKLLSSSVDRIGTMDLTADEEADKMASRKDEIGLMTRSIITLRGAIVNIVDQLQKQSNDLYESSESLNDSAEETATTIEQVERAVTEIADGATSQAGETQKATENVIMMGNLVEETTEEVQSLIENARRMRDSSNEAKETLRSLDEINRSAIQSIAVIAEQTNTTNESALKIREATDLITSIAEETNLLSLNASIEAARAGEQGRGFAVVAGQISKLAEQSNESARQIEAIISALIADSKKAVETMDEVKAIMERQNKNVLQTGEMFAQVDDGIQASIEGVRAIRDKAKTMDETRVNVVDVVQNLTAIAEENAASTEETSASVTEVSAIISGISDQANQLKVIADGLAESMKIFKLS